MVDAPGACCEPRGLRPAIALARACRLPELPRRSPFACQGRVGVVEKRSKVEISVDDLVEPAVDHRLGHPQERRLLTD